MTIYDSMYNWKGTTLYQSEKRHDMPIKLSMNDIIQDFLLKKTSTWRTIWRNHYTNPTKKLSEGVDSIQKAGENEHPSFQVKKNYQPLDPPQKKMEKWRF